ncbi:hypothetical protein ACWDTI_08220 [Gordonia sp. NPDC003424]
MGELADSAGGQSDGWMLALSPDDAAALERQVEETAEAVGELEISRSFSVIAAVHASTSQVYWLSGSALEALAKGRELASDATSVLALGTSGSALFESPVGRYELTEDTDDLGDDDGHITEPYAVVTVRHETLPKAKQVCTKAGWPDVAPLETVGIVVGE